MISSIEERKLDSAIATRNLPISITQEKLDSADIQSRPSRAKKLFKNRTSLRDAFLLKEILNRPYT